MTMSESRSEAFQAENAADALLNEEPVWTVLRGLCCRPIEKIVRRWNWKAAFLSSLIRSLIFLFANMSAGYSAALAAMAREFGFRAVASGFYGGITQSFRVAQPRWLGTLTAVLLMPVLNHSAEFLLHSLLRTPNLKTSMGASIGFTVLSTGFNLFAMRKGVLITGPNNQNLAQDLKMMPKLLLSYTLLLLTAPWSVIACFMRKWNAANRPLLPVVQSAEAQRWLHD